jgi:hypothetical protein
LYLLDGFMTFVAAAHIAQTTLAFSLRQVRPVVVVGVAPVTDDLDRLLTQRNRDLTPSNALPAQLRGRTLYGTAGAGAMLELIGDVVAPHLESIYPLDHWDWEVFRSAVCSPAGRCGAARQASGASSL